MDVYDLAVHFKHLRNDREQEAKGKVLELLTSYKMMALAVHSDAKAFVDSIDKSIAQSEGTYNEEIGDIAGLTALKAEMEVNRCRKRAV